MTKRISLLLVFVFSAFFITGCESGMTVKTADEFIPVQQRTFAKSSDFVFDKVISTLKVLKWRVTKSSKEDGFVIAKVPMSFWTWGDTVKINIKDTDNDRTQVDVTSGTAQVVDYGKNKKNIEKFYSKLRTELR